MPFFDPTAETLSREALRALQERKLRDLLEQLSGRNRFYTEKLQAAGVTFADIRGLDDLPKLPLTTKSELV